MNKKFLLNRRCVMGLLFSAVLGGCSDLELGPPPSNYVGPAQSTVPITLPDTAATQPASQAATAPESPPAPLPPLALSIQDAILMGLEHNPNLYVQRLSPLISRNNQEAARAAFDPTVSAGVSAGRNEGAAGTLQGGGVANQFGESMKANAGIQQTMPTGTTVGISADSNYNRTINSDILSSSLVTTDVTLSVTQRLLQGGSLEANLVSLRQAQLDTKISEYTLRDAAESLVANIEIAYWQYAVTQRQIEITTASLKVAQDQLDQIDELIRVGKGAESDRAAAEAEVARQRVVLIQNKSQLETQRLTLLQLLNPGDGDYWKRELQIKDQPFVPPLVLDPVEAHVEVALALRPDLNEARLQIQKGTLQIILTKNGLLPDLDLSIGFTKTAVGGSVGTSFDNINGPNYNATVGLSLNNYPLLNRAAQASYRNAVLSKEVQIETLHNATIAAQAQIRSAYVLVQTQQEQITATAVSRRAAEESLRVETAKLAVGRSTSLLVAVAQSNLLNAQLLEVQAVTNYLSDLVDLYHKEGSLLLRRQIDAPGRQTATTEATPKNR